MVIDTSLNLDFNGLIDFNSADFPVFDFKIDVEKARFYQLNLSDRSEDMDLKGQISGEFKGTDPDSFHREYLNRQPSYMLRMM